MQHTRAARGRRTTSVGAGLLLLLLECATGAHFDAVDTRRLRGTSPRVPWNYNQHGADWPGLCITDKSQSPIELPALVSLANSTETLWYRYPTRWEKPVVLYNDGMAVTATFHEKVGGIGLGPSFTSLDASWSLAQMTIHSPSEHTWGGNHMPAEIQLVHISSKPGTPPAIFSVGLERGQSGIPNLFFDSLMAEGVPKMKGDEVRTNLYSGQALPFGDLIGNDVIEYSGSASQPPCSPARYFVRAQPIQADPAHLQALMDAIALSTAVTDGNYRITQAVNERVITRVPARDATGMETQEELRIRALASIHGSTPAPSVPLTVKDGDNEDASVETEAIKRSYWYHDPTAELVKKAEASASDANALIKTYNESMIMENPNGVVNSMPKVKEAQAAYEKSNEELVVAQQELDAANAALIVAKKNRDYAEGRTNLTAGEAALMTAKQESDAKQGVVDALTAKVENARKMIEQAQGTGHDEVWKAQQEIKVSRGAIPGQGGPEPPVPTSYQLPVGPYTDPFSPHSAELTARITKQPLPRHLTQALGPNHKYIAGTVAVGGAKEEPPAQTKPVGLESPAEQVEVIEGF